VSAATPEPPGVVITFGQVYAEVRQLHDAVTQMDAKLDQLATQKTELDDHEHRLRALEERRIPHSSVTIGAGVLSTLALIITAILATVGR
jgi:hypothetical protein